MESTQSIENNWNLAVRESVMEALSKATAQSLEASIRECARVLGADENDLFRRLGYPVNQPRNTVDEDGITTIEVVLRPKPKRRRHRIRAARVAKTGKQLIPFSHDHVNLNGCHGLVYNHGLYTQCTRQVVQNQYCHVCFNEAEKSPVHEPNCGTLEKRLAASLYEFRDNKGRVPVPFRKVLANVNLSEEEVRRWNVEINPEHWEAEVRPKRGRPSSESQEQGQSNKRKRVRKSRAAVRPEVHEEAEEEAEEDDEETEVHNQEFDDDDLPEAPDMFATDAEEELAEQLRLAEEERQRQAEEAERQRLEEEARQRQLQEEAAALALAEALRVQAEQQAKPKKATKAAAKAPKEPAAPAAVKKPAAATKEKEKTNTKVTSTFLFEGKKYKRDAQGNIFDKVEGGHQYFKVGTWNHIKETIDFESEEESEEEEEDHQPLITA